MKITHISAADVVGGAARSAYRLHKGLRALGHDSTLFVEKRVSNDPSVVGLNLTVGPFARLRRGLRRQFISRNAAKVARNRPANASHFSDDRSEHLAHPLNQLPPCDVLNLHWISGFIDHASFFSSISQEQPIVWTLHDMNAFTGGCHFDDGCGRFAVSCGACPQLTSRDESDFSREVWSRKQSAYRGIDGNCLHLVTPSQWLATEVQRSSLLGGRSVSVIPYGLDTEVFHPRDRRAARDVLGLPCEARVILFLADWVMEARKGFPLLREALGGIQDISSLYLLAMGNGAPDVIVDLPMVKLGYLREERFLSLVYSAADLFVLPVLQDNLPNTALEALACGVPIVAFHVGGIPEIVRDGIEGRLVPRGDVAGLRLAICDMLNRPDTLREMSARARQRATKEFALELQARRYLELYERIIGAASSAASP